MGRYSLSTIINGKRYVVHVVKKEKISNVPYVKKVELEQAYVFIDNLDKKNLHM